MEKVMLSKLEAAALESALEINSGDRASISQYHGVQGLWTGERVPLNDLDLETINCALYVGYQVEPSPEDEALEYYQSNLDVAPVMEDLLNILNIQIKGINC